MDKQLANILYVILIISLILFMIYTVWFMTKNVEAFKSNPLTYGVEKLGGAECFCTLEDGSTIMFNETTIKMTERRYQDNGIGMERNQKYP